MGNKEKDVENNKMKDGQLKLESKCNYGQTVFFLDNRQIHTGITVGVKGEDNNQRRDLELLIYETGGNCARYVWIPEDDIFFNKEELISSLLGK